MKRLNSILSKVLVIDENKISDEISPNNLETWDSFNGLMLVSELEKEFKVSFTMQEIGAVKCVKDIKESLKKHGIDLEVKRNGS